MKNIMTMSDRNNQEVTMTSLEISQLLGSRHDKLKQSIERLVNRMVIVLPPVGVEQTEDILGRNRKTEVYIFSGEQGKRDSIILIAQNSPEFTAKLVDRWKELEEENQQLRNQPSIPDFNNPISAARYAAELALNWAEAEEGKKEALDKLEEAKPKIDFVDNYSNTDGLRSFRQVAKLLGANERDFREFLSERRIMYKLGNTWAAYKEHEKMGRFVSREGLNERGYSYNATYFTPRGVSWVTSEWRNKDLFGF